MDYKSLLFDLALAESNPSVLIYRGAFGQRIIEKLAEEVCYEIQNLEGNRTSRKIFRVFVEMAQNIMFHSSHKNHLGIGVGMIAIISEPDLYRVITCNAVKEEAEDQLRSRLTHLANFQVSELRSITHDRLKDNTNSLHGGAGLGLIDIARSSGRPLIWDFVYLPNLGQSFLLEVELPKHI